MDSVHQGPPMRRNCLDPFDRSDSGGCNFIASHDIPTTVMKMRLIAKSQDGKATMRLSILFLRRCNAERFCCGVARSMAIGEVIGVRFTLKL
jgi:hypothetical protein